MDGRPVLSAEKPKKKSILKSALQMASSYGVKGIGLLELRLYAKDRIKWIEIALAASRILKHSGHEQAHLTYLGNARGSWRCSQGHRLL